MTSIILILHLNILAAHALCRDIPCDKCKELNGACDENGKCCFRKTGNMDKDDETGESDEMDEDSKDKDDSKSDDGRKDGIDGYFVEHNGKLMFAK